MNSGYTVIQPSICQGILCEESCVYISLCFLHCVALNDFLLYPLKFLFLKCLRRQKICFSERDNRRGMSRRRKRFIYLREGFCSWKIHSSLNLNFNVFFFIITRKNYFHHSTEEFFDYHVVALVGLILVYSHFPSRNHKIDLVSTPLPLAQPSLSCFIISCRFH